MEVLLKCYNPRMEITLHQSPGDPKVYITEWIQFNVNTPADNGTLYVDADNHAVCRLVTSVVAAEGSWEFSPTNENNGAVAITFESVPLDNQRFVVMQASPHQTIVGLKFSIRIP